MERRCLHVENIANGRAGAAAGPRDGVELRRVDLQAFSIEDVWMVMRE